MYAVSAQTNDVEVVHVPLIPNPSGASSEPSFSETAEHSTDFRLDVSTISSTLTAHPEIKLIYLTSPGNPTAALLPPRSLYQLVNHPTWNGIICVDEAYIDFAQPGASCAPLVTSYPNLVVLQTLSKAFGLAGIRLGAAFAGNEVAALLNNMKAPYNVSELTSQLAIRALSPGSKHVAKMEAHRSAIIAQRDRLVAELPKIPGIGRFRGGFDANFLLVEILGRPGGKPDSSVALKVYERLAETKGVVVRFRGKEHGCEGCLRVTVGTEEEVGRFLTELRTILKGIYSEGGGKDGMNAEAEEKKEIEENGVLA